MLGASMPKASMPKASGRLVEKYEIEAAGRMIAIVR